MQQMCTPLSCYARALRYIQPDMASVFCALVLCAFVRSYVQLHGELSAGGWSVGVRVGPEGRRVHGKELGEIVCVENQLGWTEFAWRAFRGRHVCMLSAHVWAIERRRLRLCAGTVVATEQSASAGHRVLMRGRELNGECFAMRLFSTICLGVVDKCIESMQADRVAA